MKSMSMTCLTFCLLLSLSSCRQNNDASAHYQKEKDIKSLYAVLCNQVENGCSMDDVRLLLGQEDLTMSEKGHSATKKLVDRAPSNFPDGFQDSDRILAYSSDETTIVFLQFRNGQLVNHNPIEFETPPENPEVRIIGH